MLSTVNLPSDWMAAAASGEKSKSGTWEDLSADASGTAAHFRVYDSGGATCHVQGTITTVAVGTGDMLVDNDVFAAGQNFTVSTFKITSGNA